MTETIQNNYFVTAKKQQTFPQTNSQTQYGHYTVDISTDQPQLAENYIKLFNFLSTEIMAKQLKQNDYIPSENSFQLQTHDKLKNDILTLIDEMTILDEKLKKQND